MKWRVAGCLGLDSRSDSQEFSCEKFSPINDLNYIIHVTWNIIMLPYILKGLILTIFGCFVAQNNANLQLTTVLMRR